MAVQLIKGNGVRADWNYLENLAGVGHKTASVVMSQWFDIPAFPVDTHITTSLKMGVIKAKKLI